MTDLFIAYNASRIPVVPKCNPSESERDSIKSLLLLLFPTIIPQAAIPPPPPLVGKAHPEKVHLPEYPKQSLNLGNVIAISTYIC